MIRYLYLTQQEFETIKDNDGVLNYQCPYCNRLMKFITTPMQLFKLNYGHEITIDCPICENIVESIII